MAGPVQNNPNQAIQNRPPLEPKMTKCERLKRITKIALAILVTLAVFWINPATFLISFVIGVAFSKQIQKAIDRIKTFVSHYRWSVTAGTAVFALLTLPIFIATASATWSCYFGSYVSQRAQEKWREKQQAQDVRLPIG